MSREELIAENKRQFAQITALQHQLSSLQKLIYGQKSERFVPEQITTDQIGLFAQTEEFGIVNPKEPTQTNKAKKNTKPKKSKPHPGRQAIPSQIPREVIIIEPDFDTTDMVCIGTDITETLEYTPAMLICKQYVRPKYAAKGESSDTIVIADLPIRPINKGIAEAGLLAHLWVSKFIDHLPFYRQIEMMKRDNGIVIPSSTMNDWFVKCTQLLEPLYEVLKQKIQNSNYIQVDESPIKVLESENKGKSHQGYMWVYYSVVYGLVLFEYNKGRGQRGPKALLQDYRGYLQCDGYKVYDTIGKASPLITLVGCLAHARRYFYEALNTDKDRAEYALSIIQSIYVIDRQLKDGHLNGNRAELIDPLLLEIKKWCDEQVHSVLPKSAIGKAIGYFIRQWPKLKNTTIEDHIKLDNNLIENKIRPLALGRKNYLFAGNHGSAQRIAMMYSFFASCKIHGINPRIWMTDVLQRIPNMNIQNLEQLLPSSYSSMLD